MYQPTITTTQNKILRSIKNNLGYLLKIFTSKPAFKPTFGASFMAYRDNKKLYIISLAKK